MSARLQVVHRPAAPKDARQRGQGLVESVLVLPVLLLIIIGLVDVANAWKSYQVLTDAGRLGGRTWVVDNGLSAGEVDATIRQALATGGLDPDLAVITPPLGVSLNRGDPATVEIRYPYQFRFLQPLIGWTGAQATVQLYTRFRMRTE